MSELPRGIVIKKLRGNSSLVDEISDMLELRFGIFCTIFSGLKETLKLGIKKREDGNQPCLEKRRL